MQEILKSDLDSRVTLGEIEVFSSDQLKSYAQQSYDEIQKSNDSERNVQLKQVADEIRSFKPIMVTDDITLQKSVMFYRAMPLGGNDIQKGKPAAIGEVRIWDGKKMKKQPNGKWTEVTGTHGMSKKEHEALAEKYSKTEGMHVESSYHKERASKLSDKEYDEEEMEEGHKKVSFKLGDKVKLNDGFDKEGKPVIRTYTITKPGMRRDSERLGSDEVYLTSPGTIGFDVSIDWLKNNMIK